MGHKDYSGTPLWKKLGLSPGARVLVVDPPDGFQDVLCVGAPEFLSLGRPSREMDVVLLFVTARRDLNRRYGSLAARMSPAGRLWLAWPKKSAGVEADLDFATVQATGLQEGLVDNKSASITDVFQGLQFVRRLVDR